jgi:hypothetical protein
VPKGRVLVVHVAYGWLPDRQSWIAARKVLYLSTLLYPVGFVGVGSLAGISSGSRY